MKPLLKNIKENYNREEKREEDKLLLKGLFWIINIINFLQKFKKNLSI